MRAVGVPRAVALVLLIVLAVVGWWGITGQSETSPSARVTQCTEPDPSTIESASESVGSSVETTITETIRLSDLVARVRIAKIFPSRCNTPSGAPPRREDYLHAGDYMEARRHFTPIQLEIVRLYGARKVPTLPVGAVTLIWSRTEEIATSADDAHGVENFEVLAPSGFYVGAEAIVMGRSFDRVELVHLKGKPWAAVLRDLSAVAEATTGGHHTGYLAWHWYAVSGKGGTIQSDRAATALSVLEKVVTEEGARLASYVEPTRDPAEATAAAQVVPEDTWTPEPTETYVDPIFTAEEAIERSLAEFPPGITPEAPIARLVSHATIFRWTDSGPDGWWNPAHPVWLVGVRGEGLTVQAMNTGAPGSIPAISDPRLIEGIFWAWDANSGLPTAHGALNDVAGSTRTYERLRQIPNEDIAIVPATEFP